jgi:two-component system, NtrC family, sensor kinase
LSKSANRRILIVDDMPSIHEDFRKILVEPTPDPGLLEREAFFLGRPQPVQAVQYELDSAFQGHEALEKVVRSRAMNLPYAVAIVDMRMPPGWSGVETVEHLWREDPELQIAICTAYSDTQLEKVAERLSRVDHLIFIRKPFDPDEAVQMISSLVAKWGLQTGS